jgi:diacylglycerol kinase (ATP)
MKSNKFSINARAKSFSYAFAGIGYFFKTQHNAWIHLVACCLTLIFGVMCQLTATEWCIIIFCNAIVFTAEMLNTAIEWLTDLVSPDYNALAGKVKDVAAAAVLFSAMGAAIVGLIIFLPKLLLLFNSWM